MYLKNLDANMHTYHLFDTNCDDIKIFIHICVRDLSIHQTNKSTVMNLDYFKE